MHQFIQTEDGSITLYVPELNEHYHSVHGAIQESVHIFIRAGIDNYLSRHPAMSTLRILEAGFGTGLNVYLTLLHAKRLKLSIDYHTIEKYPLSPDETARLNYTAYVGSDKDKVLFSEIHQCSWEKTTSLTPFFQLCKQKGDFREITFPSGFDILFFDAFNPNVQPYLWTTGVFRKFAAALKPNGILVTYCVKGTVKQALRQCGFTLERLPGPPGKREMLRAVLQTSQTNLINEK